MSRNFLPTKRNLISAKINLNLAMKGHDILDKKQKILIHELNRAKHNVSQLKKQLAPVLKKAKAAMETAETKAGAAALKKFRYQTEPIFSSPPYTLWESSTYVDEAFFAWQQATMLQQKLTEAEANAQNLSARLSKIQKRAAALENIVIPAYQTGIKYMSLQLEERERDELVRVRVRYRLKSKHQYACAQTDAHPKCTP